MTADVGQAGGMVVGAVVIHMVCSSRSEVSALLALGTPLFNGDCVTATSTGAASIEISLFETAPAHSANWYKRYAAQARAQQSALRWSFCLLDPAALQRALLCQGNFLDGAGVFHEFKAMVRAIGSCGNRFAKDVA